MNNAVRSDEELIAVLERTMQHVSAVAPDMGINARSRSPRWIRSAVRRNRTSSNGPLMPTRGRSGVDTGATLVDRLTPSRPQRTR